MSDKTDGVLLVSGLGHSGTRLMACMLGVVDAISVPSHLLNEVAEYQRLHDCFIEMLDRTSVEASTYRVDEPRLKELIDDYVGQGEGWVVLKMPVYPLLILEQILDAVDRPVRLVVVERQFEHVVRSYRRRLEDLYYSRHPDERRRWIMRLPVEKRRQSIDGKKTFETLLREVKEHLDSQIRKCHRAGLVKRTAVVPIEPWVLSERTRRCVLERLGFDGQRVTEMGKLANPERLLEKRPLQERPITALKRIGYRLWSRLASQGVSSRGT